MNKVLCTLPVLGHPRDSKPIAMLQEAGFAVEAIAFERDYTLVACLTAQSKFGEDSARMRDDAV